MVSLLLALIYLAFIALGLPDSLLGAAWPSMYIGFNVPISYAGILSMLIAFMTIISSLGSSFLTKKLGSGRVTCISVGLTGLALLGFSFASEFWMLCLLAVPYGLGAGGVDATLNNYVSLHFSSFHMSMLHCMWGVGASIGPYIMSYALTYKSSWNKGYLYISIIQMILTGILFISLPLWKKKEREDSSLKPKEEKTDESLEEKKNNSVFSSLKIKGVIAGMLTFFCYSAVEQTTGLWASSYLVLHNGLDATLAASCASLFYIGITGGRFISAFLTLKISDRNMVRLGEGIILIGLVLLFIPSSYLLTLVGLVIIGLGCAPIFPCLIHSTPTTYGKENSQSVIGLQMAASYLGTLVMPPLFGGLVNTLSASFLPVYLSIFLGLVVIMSQVIVMRTKGNLKEETALKK